MSNQRSPAYRTCARTICQLVQLQRRGLDDSPEADSLRDESDVAWRELTAAEQERLAALSETLQLIDEETE
jgi:hypothetical protein